MIAGPGLRVELSRVELSRVESAGVELSVNEPQGVGLLPGREISGFETVGEEPEGKLLGTDVRR